LISSIAFERDASSVPSTFRTCNTVTLGLEQLHAPHINAIFFIDVYQHATRCHVPVEGARPDAADVPALARVMPPLLRTTHHAGYVMRHEAAFA
jgi:hypothetical protein